MFADELELRALLAEHVGAAADAGVIQRGLGGLLEVVLEVVDHAQQIAAGALQVALAEHHGGADGGHVADGDELVFGVDAGEVAHEVVVAAAAGLRPGLHEADEGVAGGGA